MTPLKVGVFPNLSVQAFINMPLKVMKVTFKNVFIITDLRVCVRRITKCPRVNVETVELKYSELFMGHKLHK